MNKQRVSPFYKKWWFWVGTLVVILILALFIEPPQNELTTQHKDAKKHIPRN